MKLNVRGPRGGRPGGPPLLGRQAVTSECMVHGDPCWCGHTPAVLKEAAVPFVTEQPTGMLVVGNVVFVAGGRDLMAFDMAAKVAPTEPAPVLATCGAACAGVAHDPGQNLHSMSYRLQNGRHYIFMSAQIDNAIGAVEILDPKVIARL